jgi:hypothetical protein
MARLLILLYPILALILPISAQFNFFEQMFGGQGHQQQQAQNAGSDSTWYRHHYEGGTYLLGPSTLSVYH